VDLDRAKFLCSLPKSLGINPENQKDIILNSGRFGPYIRHDSKFYSIPKDEDPLEITTDRAIEIILAKRKADAEKVIKIFNETDPLIQVLNGRWGPYISKGKENFKIPKGTDPNSLNLTDVEAIIADDANKPKKMVGKAKAATAAPKKTKSKKK